MSKELDKIIEKVYGPTQPEHDCFGNFEDKQHAKNIATEYADSDEVKRRHYMEFIQAASDHAEAHHGEAHVWAVDGVPYFHGSCKMHAFEALGIDQIAKLLGLIK